jgi:hypothetical protein
MNYLTAEKRNQGLSLDHEVLEIFRLDKLNGDTGRQVVNFPGENHWPAKSQNHLCQMETIVHVH